MKKVITGQAIVRRVVSYPRREHSPWRGMFADCFVTRGIIKYHNDVQIVRGRKIIWRGKLSDLLRNNDDAKEVHAGFVYTIGLQGFDNYEVGTFKPADSIQAFEYK